MKRAQLRAVGGQKLRNMFCPKKAMKIHALVIVVHKRAKISQPIAETLEKTKATEFIKVEEHEHIGAEILERF